MSRLFLSFFSKPTLFLLSNKSTLRISLLISERIFGVYRLLFITAKENGRELESIFYPTRNEFLSLAKSVSKRFLKGNSHFRDKTDREREREREREKRKNQH